MIINRPARARRSILPFDQSPLPLDLRERARVRAFPFLSPSSAVFPFLIVAAWCAAETFAASPASPKDSAPRPAPVPAIDEPFPAGLSQEDRAQLRRDLKRLADKLSLIRSNTISSDAAKLDTLADADLFH